MGTQLIADNAVLGDMSLDAASQRIMEAKYAEMLTASLLQLLKKL